MKKTQEHQKKNNLIDEKEKIKLKKEIEVKKSMVKNSKEILKTN